MRGTVAAVPVGRLDGVVVRRCVSCGRCLNRPRAETLECNDCSKFTASAKRRSISLTIEEIRELLRGGDADVTTSRGSRVRRSHAASA